MTPVTHALLPIILGRRWLPERAGLPTWPSLLLIGGSGVLPDVLQPHLWLHARHASLSHTFWAFMAFVGVTMMIDSLAGPLRHSRLAWLCIMAYGSHLILDSVSGGITLFYPISSVVYGGPYILVTLWIVSDAVLLLIGYVIFRWLPMRERIHKRSTIH